MLNPLIKLNYIPKKYASTAISNCILEIEEENILEESCLTTTAIIDNIDKAIKVQSSQFDVFHTKRCTSNNLMEAINSIIDLGYSYIIINNFDIAVEQIKQTLMEIANEHCTIMYINNIVNMNTDERWAIDFDAEILSMSDKEWEEVKQTIEDKQKEIESMASIEEFEEQELNTTQKKELFKLFNVEDLSEIEDDYYLNESYTHTIDGSSLTIFLKDKEFIIGNDKLDFIEISHKHLNFLIEIMQKQLL